MVLIFTLIPYHILLLLILVTLRKLYLRSKGLLVRKLPLLKYNDLYRLCCLCMHYSHSLFLYVQYFRGNRDRNTVVMHILRPKIEARVIRVHPVRWVNHISMRVEFYGRAAGRSLETESD